MIEPILCELGCNKYGFNDGSTSVSSIMIVEPAPALASTPSVITNVGWFEIRITCSSSDSSL